MKTLEFSAGRMACRPIRDFLKRCKFDGKNIDFYESSGLFQRTFIIKGNDYDIECIRLSLVEWQKNIFENKK